MFSHFDTIPASDKQMYGQTDRQTDRHMMTAYAKLAHCSMVNTKTQNRRQVLGVS